MKTKNHSRAADKKNFSIALPKVLIGQLAAIAKAEARSRNGQIQKFLQDAVAAWMQEKNEIAAQTKHSASSAQLRPSNKHQAAS